MRFPLPILTPPRSEWIAWHENSAVTSAGISTVVDGQIYLTKPSLRGDCHAREAPVPRPMTQLEWLQSTQPSTEALISDRLAFMERRAGFTMFQGQREMLRHLAATRGAVVAAEVGTGKTMMAIALIEVLRPRRCLVIAPQGVIARGRKKGEDETAYDASQWEREFAKFAPWMNVMQASGRHVPSDGTVTLTYMQDALLNDGGWLSEVPPNLFDMIVVDEAHLVADPSTKMARALFRMQPHYRFALTATPMPNHPCDADALCRWVRPDVYLQDLDYSPKDTCLSALACRLRHAIAPIRKADVRPDMPPLTIIVHDVEPEPGFREKYLAELTRIRDTNSCGMARRMQIGGLRGVCAESTAKAKAVADELVAMTTKALCVSARVAQTSLIIEEFQKHDVWGPPEIRRIDSLSDAKLHGTYSKGFQEGDIDALFMGIKCAYGHSFPDQREIAIASLEWCHGSLDQALGRVYRINSKKPVAAHIFLLKDTIEQEMFDRVCSKRSAIEAVLFGEDHQPARIVRAADHVGAGGA